MNFKFNKKFSISIIILLFTLSSSPAISGMFPPGDGRPDTEFQHRNPPRPPLGIWRNPHITQKLKLTEVQIKQLRDTDFSFREKRQDLKARLNRFHLQMEKAFSDEIVVPGTVLKFAQNISELNAKLFIQEIESFLAIGEILTADQIKVLKLDQMKRHGIHPERQNPMYLFKQSAEHGRMKGADDKKPFKN